MSNFNVGQFQGRCHLFMASREEKSSSHITMIATFLDNNKPSEFALFQTHRSYSISSNLSNVGESFGGRIRKDLILAERVYKFVACAARVSREDRKRTAISLWS